MSEISSNLKLIEDAITRNDVETVSSLLETIKKETKGENLPALKKTISNLAYKSMVYGSYPVFEFFLKQDKKILTTPMNGNGNCLLQNVATIGTFDAFKKSLEYYEQEKIDLASLFNARGSNIIHTIVSIGVSPKDLPAAADDARNRINQMLTMIFSVDPSAFFRMCEQENQALKKPFHICKEESTYSHIISIAKKNSKNPKMGAALLNEVKRFADLQDAIRNKMLQPTYGASLQNQVKVK
ncbi:MAG: hypothetical protein KGH54_01665 [Candidatus Micrarchaeota archaeon]|nr:hypothetical protein [Candidatus Micrarchaeota archaeon]